MANFFEPGKGSIDQSTTLSPADQALKQFKTELLMRMLNAMAGPRTSFADFVKGAPGTTPMPSGMGDLGAAAIAAMQKPGAFTSTAHQTGTPPSTSGFSDLASVLGLGGSLLAQTGLLNKLLSLRGVGLQQNTDPNDPSAGGNGAPLTTGMDMGSGQGLFPADNTQQDLFLNSLFSPGGQGALMDNGSTGDFLSQVLGNYNYF